MIKRDTENLQLTNGTDGVTKTPDLFFTAGDLPKSIPVIFPGKCRQHLFSPETAYVRPEGKILNEDVAI